MGVLFDGRLAASQKLDSLVPVAAELKRKGIQPKLVSILVGENPGSKLYLSLKKKAGEKVGVEVDIKEFFSSVKKDEVVDFIQKINNDPRVHGIMVQLPLPDSFSYSERDEIIATILDTKDVDGLKAESKFVTPVVKAVIEAVREGEKIVRLPYKEHPCRVVVVGSKGFEGEKIINEFTKIGYEVEGVDRSTKNAQDVTSAADILISATGSSGIINSPKQIKENAIVIDVGSPKGDVVTQNLTDKAGFISPVPGGVGPMTIACLMENVIDATK